MFFARGASSMLGSLAGALLFCTIQNAINQPGPMTSYTRPVVAAQTYLTCKGAY